MGQLGIQELIFIFVIALLVFGPKKLPELGKSLGKGLKEFKRATDDLKSSWNEQVRDAERTVDDVKASVTKDLPTKSDFYDEYDTPAAEPEAPVPPATEESPQTDPKVEPAKTAETKDEVHQA